MDQNSKDQTLEGLTKSENILIVAARDLAFDGLASGLALYLSLAKLDKQVIILAPEPQVADAQKIYGVDHVGKTSGIKTPLIIVRNAPQTVDKVTYFLDGDTLKVVIHPLAQGSGVAKDQISLEYTNNQIELVFALGFASFEKLRSEITREYTIDSNTRIISIDKQEPSQKYAQSNFIDPNVTSVGEITAKLIQDLALPIDEDIAYNLYAAIREATGNFSPAKASTKTLEIASWLLKFGAGRASLAQGESGRARIAQKFDQNRHEETSSALPPSQVPSASPLFDRIPTIEELEGKQEHTEVGSGDWLKPPKIYQGSKSFDREN